MGILSDEPLVDDSALDDFDWSAVPDQSITQGSNIMESYHRIMLNAALVLSAGAFKLGSMLMGRAVHHQGKLKEIAFIAEHERLHRLYAKYNMWDGGVYFEDEEFSDFTPRVEDGHPNQWVDAEPEWLSGFDPIQDYRRK